MDEVRETQAAPSWFTIAAVGALLWELLGCAIFMMRAMVDPAALPLDERAVVNAMPQWVVIAFAISVLTGLAGAVLLLLRRRLAEPLLLVSLIAVIIQDSAYLLVPELQNLVASNDLFLPFVVILVCYGIWMLSRRARKQGWLR